MRTQSDLRKGSRMSAVNVTPEGLKNTMYLLDDPVRGEKCVVARIWVVEEETRLHDVT